MRYLTLKLEFVSNILWIIVANIQIVWSFLKTILLCLKLLVGVHFKDRNLNKPDYFLEQT